jgi:hypothetical protein
VVIHLDFLKLHVLKDLFLFQVNFCAPLRGLLSLPLQRKKQRKERAWLSSARIAAGQARGRGRRMIRSLRCPVARFFAQTSCQRPACAAFSPPAGHAAMHGQRGRSAMCLEENRSRAFGAWVVVSSFFSNQGRVLLGRKCCNYNV